ncbi:MAG: methionyl-tRNA formyltransferase [Bacillota bacterium]|nr:methionyl-tRNA formyltransferase [Bacillota bacterium]
MRIVFMGTPDFAVPSLDMLVKSGYEVVAVVTQPDKPKGRGNKLAAPPVKEYAVNAGIRVLQPVKVKTGEFPDELRKLSPDLFVTVAYGRILTQGVLDIPRLGCINVHGSLLPKYRGPTPIQWAVINGDRTTGITTMFTDVGLDTGDILLKHETEIGRCETVGQLHDRLAVIGAQVLKETLEQLEKGTLPRVPQPEDFTYAPMITKETGLIAWNKTSEEIYNLVRGTDPWPGAYTFYKGERMRVWKVSDPDIKDYNNSKSGSNEPGKILSAAKDGIIVQTGDGTARILELQFDSGKRMGVGDYLVGHKIDTGEILGMK